MAYGGVITLGLVFATALGCGGAVVDGAAATDDAAGDSVTAATDVRPDATDAPDATAAEPDTDAPDTDAPDDTQFEPDTDVDDDAAACVPACEGVACGPDGCGGSCGDCTSWVATFGASGAPTDVAIDGARRVVAIVFAYGEAPLDFGGGARDCGTEGWVPYLVAYEATGNHAFSRCFPGWELNLDGFGNGHVATAPDQGVTLAGAMNGNVDWGKGPSPYAGGFDAYVARFTPRGGPLWSRVFGDHAYQGVSALAVDAAGDIVVAIQNNGTLVVDDTTFTSLGGSDIVLVKLHPDGTTAWARSFGDGGLEQVVTALGIAADGDLLIAGAFSGTLDFGGGPLVAPGPDDHSHDDGFVARLTGDGEHVWSRAFGSRSAAVHAGAVGPDGRFAVTGTIQDEAAVVLDGVTLAGQGTFVVVLDGDGAAVWGRSPTASYVLPLQLAFDPAGRLYVGSDAGLHTRLERFDGTGQPLAATDVGSTFLMGLAHDGEAVVVVGTGPVALPLPTNPAGGASFIARLRDDAPAR